LYGEEYAYDDPVCQSISRMTREVLKARNPVPLGNLLDSFPYYLSKNSFSKKPRGKLSKHAISLYKKIAEYKVSYK